MLNRIRKVMRGIHKKCYVVAGLPRCGTTLMCTALTKRKISIYRDPGFLISFQKFSGVKGTVYKTHDPEPPSKLDDTVKVIFVFGDPRDAVVSIHNNLKLEKAYINTHSYYTIRHHDEIFYRDLMRLEEIFNNWHRHQGFPFIAVRYESLFEKKIVDILEEFLEIRLNYPRYRKRPTSWRNHPKKKYIEETYGELAVKISRAEPIKIWERKE